MGPNYFSHPTVGFKCFQNPSAPQHGGPSGSRAIPRTAPSRTSRFPLVKTQQIKPHQEFLCSGPSPSRCTDCFPLTPPGRRGRLGHYLNAGSSDPTYLCWLQRVPSFPAGTSGVSQKLLQGNHWAAQSSAAQRLAAAHTE